MQLDLLFGVQSWRKGAFDLENLYDTYTMSAGLPDYEKEPIQALYSYVFDSTNTTNGTYLFGEHEHMESENDSDGVPH
jgi:hypothetical protein